MKAVIILTLAALGTHYAKTHEEPIHHHDLPSISLNDAIECGEKNRESIDIESFLKSMTCYKQADMYGSELAKYRIAANKALGYADREDSDGYVYAAAMTNGNSDDIISYMESIMTNEDFIVATKYYKY